MQHLTNELWRIETLGSPGSPDPTVAHHRKVSSKCLKFELGAFLRGLYRFSLFLCGFFLGVLASSYSPET